MARSMVNGSRSKIKDQTTDLDQPKRSDLHLKIMIFRSKMSDLPCSGCNIPKFDHILILIRPWKSKTIKGLSILHLSRSENPVGDNVICKD